MDEGTIVEWRKKVGDDVKSGDVVCEVETDKAIMDYEAATEGKLLKILVDAGGKAAVGQPIAILGAEGEDISALETQAGLAKPAPPAEEKPKRDPEKSPGAERAENTEVEKGDKAPSVEEIEKARAAAGRKGAAAPADRAAHAIGDVHKKASPLARKIAEERGVDIAAVAGSGPGGRVVKADVEQAQAGPKASPTATAGVVRPGDEVVELSSKRKTIARRMAESKFSAPHFYLALPVDMEGLLQARSDLNAERAAGGGDSTAKVSLNAFLVKLAAMALARHPQVNASWAGDRIVRHHQADISLAVSVDDGLVAPVVRDCVGKGIVQIDEELRALVARARENKLRAEELAEPTFTISNLGNYGIESFTAIINPPASAILAVGQVRLQPVVDESGAVVVRRQMRLTLSCDHRVIDGAAGAAFLRDLKEMMESPLHALY
jgi:pyruvate dehydrogenase E2 component (dihydrolipoamide acetyltransferase)